MPWIYSSASRSFPYVKASVSFLEAGGQKFDYDALLDTGSPYTALPGRTKAASKRQGANEREFYSAVTLIRSDWGTVALDLRSTGQLSPIAVRLIGSKAAPKKHDLFRAVLTIEGQHFYHVPLIFIDVPEPDSPADRARPDPCPMIVGCSWLFDVGGCSFDKELRRFKRKGYMFSRAALRLRQLFEGLGARRASAGANAKRA